MILLSVLYSAFLATCSHSIQTEALQKEIQRLHVSRDLDAIIIQDNIKIISHLIMILEKTRVQLEKQLDDAHVENEKLRERIKHLEAEKAKLTPPKPAVDKK